jgi:formylglycine-generating enzyme required for sulfatase activity
MNKVFISSTESDLAEARREARDAALKTGFHPVMFEHWPASGGRVPLEACREAVLSCDLLVVIVAHRYGWAPPEQPAGNHKSITRLECEWAAEAGKEIIAFLIDEQAPWATDLREEYAATLAVLKGTPTLAEIAAIRRNVEELKIFKDWLASKGVRAKFRSAPDLRGEIIAALNDWRLRRVGSTSLETVEEDATPARYLRHLFEITRYIDIRGLRVGSGKAHQFSIEELYIPLGLKGASQSSAARIPAALGLRTLLNRPRLVIIGDPGSGKTTLVRRVANTLAAIWLKMDAEARRLELGLENEVPLPLFIRISDLALFIERRRRAIVGEDLPSSMDSPEWLVRFLETAARENAWGLDANFYRKRLREGCLVLLDGLDETPSRHIRILTSAIIRNCGGTYEHSHFVVTSRPRAYDMETALSGYEQVVVEPLGDSAVQMFLRRWSSSLFADAPALAEQHFLELDHALEARSEIRRMASNPVMLTALAVVHWNEKRIPEQRAELYESIITWLSRAREDRVGRASAERCISILQDLALGMQNHAQGRQVEAPLQWAAKFLADRFSAESSPSAVEAAQAFLAEEELDSGIVVARGAEIRFWHLSFQEFLAARALAALPEANQTGTLFSDPGRLLSAEWREVVLLFAGILHRQGAQKLTSMLDAIMACRFASLSTRAQLVGLIGAIQRDLASQEFQFKHPLFDVMRQEVMSVFQLDGAASLSLEAKLEAADGLGQTGDPRFDSDTWVSLPAVEFVLGVQSGDAAAPGYHAWALPTDGPPRRVRESSFRIGRFPVTAAEYEKFVVSGGYVEQEFWSAGGHGLWRRPFQWDQQLRYPNRPVTGVSWYEAMAYCQWRGQAVRLLTEAEWERAAAGSVGRPFPWGAESPDPSRLNFAGAEGGDALQRQSLQHATPVGFYPAGATPEGVLDLAGNVFEWCSDKWLEPCADRELRVVRGGCYASVTLFVRSAFRGRYPAGKRADHIGFRVCRSIDW